MLLELAPIKTMNPRYELELLRTKTLGKLTTIAMSTFCSALLATLFHPDLSGEQKGSIINNLLVAIGGLSTIWLSPIGDRGRDEHSASAIALPGSEVKQIVESDRDE